jgi:hypothetical protein
MIPGAKPIQSPLVSTLDLVPINGYFGITRLAGGVATLLLTPDVLIAYPFLVEEAVTVNQLRTIASTGGTLGALYTMSVYDSIYTGGRWYPNLPVATMGAVDGNAATVRIVDITPVTFQRAIYWQVYNCNNLALEPTLRAIPIANLLNIGYNPALGTNNQYSALSIAKPYDGLIDSPFPAGAGVVANALAPQLLFRRAA